MITRSRLPPSSRHYLFIDFLSSFIDSFFESFLLFWPDFQKFAQADASGKLKIALKVIPVRFWAFFELKCHCGWPNCPPIHLIWLYISHPNRGHPISKWGIHLDCVCRIVGLSYSFWFGLRRWCTHAHRQHRPSFDTERIPASCRRFKIKRRKRRE